MEEKKSLKNFKSCVSTPIFSKTPDECPIMEIFVMSELHLLTGITKYLLKTCEKIDVEKLQKWFQQCNVSRQGMNGDFNVNVRKTIFKKALEL